MAKKYSDLAASMDPERRKRAQAHAETHSSVADGDCDDYEAMGYPETEVGNRGQFLLDVWVDRLLFAMLDAGVDWFRARINENEDCKEKLDDKATD